MDVLFFLKERTKFIRYFYKAAGKPFHETMLKIKEGEPPFDDPPYSEDGEPPYLDEWMRAEDGLEVLGRTCISMLSSSLQLYFKTWESELNIRWAKGERKRVFRKGFLQGYRTCFGEVLDLSWDDCPADLEVIEQITLARNRDQHPEHIVSMRVGHSRKDLEKHPRPFFVSEIERKMYADLKRSPMFLMNSSLHVSCKALYTAIEEIEKLAEWMEGHMFSVKHGS